MKKEREVVTEMKKNSKERDIKRRRRYGRQWQSRCAAFSFHRGFAIDPLNFFLFLFPSFFSFFHVFLCSFSFSLMFMLFSYFSRLLRLSCVSSRFSVCIFTFSSFGKDQFSADFFRIFFSTNFELFYFFTSSNAWKNALYLSGNLQLTMTLYFIIRMYKVH